MSSCRYQRRVERAVAGTEPWSSPLHEHADSCEVCLAAVRIGDRFESALPRAASSLVSQPMSASELGADLRPPPRAAWLAGAMRFGAAAAVVVVAATLTTLGLRLLTPVDVGNPSRTVETLILAEDDERVFALTGCMREHGWQVADPDLSVRTGHVVPGFSTVLDAPDEQVKFNRDLRECAERVGIPYADEEGGREE